MAVLGAFLFCLGVVAAFGIRSAITLVRARRRPEATPLADLHRFPTVTVQIPVCDDAALAARAIASVAAVDYPRDRFDVQVCDDSRDPDAIASCGRLVEAYRAQGVVITHLRRDDRRGFKAGNLNHALATARGEFVAIVDADFQIPADFLRRTLPFFEGNPRLAAVQTHFGHTNAGANLLTRAFQAMYDFHLHLEQRTRSNWNLWMEFMGSAGIWRRAAIVDCGGWPAATGTEDVHLSLLAQCRGWSIRFSTATVSKGHLPETIAAFRRQQFRWALSMGMLTRMLGWRILTAEAPLAARLEGFLHLTGYCVYGAMAGVMLLSWPVVHVAITQGLPAWFEWITMGLLGSSVVLGSLATNEANRRAARSPLEGFTAGVLLTFISTGMSVLAARAYLAGLLGAPIRTWEPSGSPEGRHTRMMLDRVLEGAAVVSTGVATIEGWQHGFAWLPIPGLFFGTCTLLFATAPVWLPMTRTPAPRC